MYLLLNYFSIFNINCKFKKLFSIVGCIVVPVISHWSFIRIFPKTKSYKSFFVTVPKTYISDLTNSLTDQIYTFNLIFFKQKLIFGIS